MRTAFKFCIIALAISAGVVLPIIGLANVHHVDAWEKANGYPFGQMCHSIFTGFVDTCRR